MSSALSSVLRGRSRSVRPQCPSRRLWAPVCASLAAAGAQVACELDVPQVPHATDREVSFEGSGEGDAGVATVFVAHSPKSNAPLPRLFTGILSDYHRSHADDPELSNTLAPREIPLWVARAGTEQTLVPLLPLSPRSQYSLVIAPGRVVEFVTRRGLPKLVVAWPSAGLHPDSNHVTSRVAVYCAASSASAPSDVASELSMLDVGAGASSNPSPSSWPSHLGKELRLYGGSPAHFERLPGRPSCALLSVDGTLSRGGDLVPPRLQGVLVQPRLFTPSVQATASAQTACTAAATLGPGCAVVHDDRLLLLDDVQAALWCFSGALEGCVASEPGRPAVVRGLAPETSHRVQLEVTRADGSVWSSAPDIETATERPHLVINEVLANPNGPEPQQEWIELYNDGHAAIELGGWQLADSSGSSELPSLEIAAAGYVLLVNENFDIRSELDVAPPPDASVLALPRLAVGGLSNGGEALKLIDPGGRVVSRWPALSGPAGVSLARRTPSANEAADTDIGPHAEPGASPGRPNVAGTPAAGLP